MKLKSYLKPITAISAVGLSGCLGIVAFDVNNVRLAYTTLSAIHAFNCGVIIGDSYRDALDNGENSDSLPLTFTAGSVSIIGNTAGTQYLLNFASSNNLFLENTIGLIGLAVLPLLGFKRNSWILFFWQVLAVLTYWVLYEIMKENQQAFDLVVKGYRVKNLVRFDELRRLEEKKINQVN